MTGTSTVNHRQAHAWNGPLGRHWADHHRRFDTMLGEADEALFAAAAIGPGDRVLDIGCGAGATTRAAALLAAPGHAVGVDISAPLVDRARARTAQEGVPNAAYQLGDVQAHPFPPGVFDVAISRGGVMFFEDHVTAFANVARALRPRGRLAFVCPRRPDPDSEEVTALSLFARRLAEGSAYRAGQGPAAPDPDAQAAHTAMASLSEPYRVHAVLHRSFTDIAVNPVDIHTHWGDSPADAVDFLLSRAPARSVPSATRALLEDTLRPYATPRGVRTRAGVWLVTALRRDDAGA
ncbi:class I SAM-dependent methyltransferase [Streptomyces sp. VRA16 Mangrove soil]|uniref:class I SAM-dependent methyltransferase n=1 Tax=Streptomyces sp. VRA16 Mangrove soil TaxID=2817434 RepID=UPI001A9DC461|nr:class I SAM-dependent methyltransferase [Streptomyces sp. VRA16 Mangrove soil]MBO1331176.1 methyltransferase domain-containing protein [Streptomyces sp. VRA16 Mangrove soil]